MAPMEWHPMVDLCLQDVQICAPVHAHTRARVKWRQAKEIIYDRLSMTSRTLDVK